MLPALEGVVLGPEIARSSVRALFLHAADPTRGSDGEPNPMFAVQQVEALFGRGLAGDVRFLRATRSDGSENLRQVSLIDEATLDRHAPRFGALPLERVKSQLVLVGVVHLPDLLHHFLVFGEEETAAVLQVTVPRQPCEQMDCIAPGLREAMLNGEQGALARVVRGGILRVGQIVSIRSRTDQPAQPGSLSR